MFSMRILGSAHHLLVIKTEHPHRTRTTLKLQFNPVKENEISLLSYLQNPLSTIPTYPPPVPNSNTTNAAYNADDINSIGTWNDFNLETILQRYQKVLFQASFPPDPMPASKILSSAQPGKLLHFGVRMTMAILSLLSRFLSLLGGWMMDEQPQMTVLLGLWYLEMFARSGPVE